eukprot:TRINITY_DN13111_c1_g2_i3.p1 TRINITY_DN13111_c1_g2~~TRINITY_DN13111_c1_g2_i3.p1  ORF type:complete len:112 (-),score=15.29 TRINITY_DN13111_c1_g2_i3:1048-1383(-)
MIPNAIEDHVVQGWPLPALVNIERNKVSFYVIYNLIFLFQSSLPIHNGRNPIYSPSRGCNPAEKSSVSVSTVSPPLLVFYATLLLHLIFSSPLQETTGLSPPCLVTGFMLE